MQHDQILENVKDKFRDVCLDTLVCQEYILRNGKHGEFDLLAITEHSVIAVEAKTRDCIKNRIKAYYQLDRDYDKVQELYPKHYFIALYAYSCKNEQGYEVELYFAK